MDSIGDRNERGWESWTSVGPRRGNREGVSRNRTRPPYPVMFGLLSWGVEEEGGNPSWERPYC